MGFGGKLSTQGGFVDKFLPRMEMATKKAANRCGLCLFVL
jgi:hypothetical protein